jgi:hypothetical protein
MAIVISNEGEALLLEYAMGKTAAADQKLRLYTNDYTPLHTSVVASFTEMGAVQGYTLKTLTTTSWGAATPGTGTGTSTSNKASIAYAQQTFTADGTGGSQTVYGYFVTDNAGTTLLYAERFSTAKTYANVGDAIKITPGITNSQE